MNMREAFEAWIMSTARRAGTHVNKDSTGKYLDNRVDAKWSAWQAALAAQAQQTEYTFDQLTKLLMQAATKEGHKVTMKIKWAQPPAPEEEKPSCRQCGAPSGNSHCLGDIFNCSDLAAPEGGE